MKDLKDSKDSNLSLLLNHAEVAIDTRNNTIIKCRPGLDLYFDYFSQYEVLRIKNEESIL